MGLAVNDFMHLMPAYGKVGKETRQRGGREARGQKGRSALRSQVRRMKSPDEQYTDVPSQPRSASPTPSD